MTSPAAGTPTSPTAAGRPSPRWRGARTAAAVGAAAVVGVGGLSGCAAGLDRPAPSSATATTTATTGSAASAGASSAAVPSGMTATVPAGAAGRPRGGVDLAAVDQQDPNAVAQAVLIMANASDSALDTTPADAERRAAPLLDAHLAAVLAAPLGGNGGGGTAFLELAAHHGWQTATVQFVSQDGGVPDTASTALRTAIVTVSAHSPDPSWTVPPSAAIWSVHMTRPDPTRPWRVTQLSNLGPA